jgi:cation diffusion facilitator family transporter
MAAQADSLKSIIYALVANLAIAVAKLVAAVLTGSTSMLAEAVHSMADCGNQALLIVGLRRAKRPASADHPLGHGKAIYFWSFIVAVMLFSMGGVFSIYEGWHKWASPEPLAWPWLAVGILVFSVIAEAISLRACLIEINKVRDGRSLWDWFQESRQSELIVILGEDLAAMLGLVIALFAVVLTMITGKVVFDAAGSISIGVILITIALLIGAEIQALLIGQSAETKVVRAIHEVLSTRHEIDAVLNLITLQLGSEIMVAVKARMREFPTQRELIEAINHCEAALRATIPEVRWIFFEPDIED